MMITHLMGRGGPPGRRGMQRDVGPNVSVQGARAAMPPEVDISDGKFDPSLKADFQWPLISRYQTSEAEDPLSS